MKIKHHEIEIPQENPFANCKLAREPYARVLTDIVNTYADGFVLAINNEWGTGKTTFVKMWQQQLKNEGFKTIYFNAWENDFDSNPIVALMSELETLTNAKNKKVFKSVVEKVAVLVKNIAPTLAKALIKKYVVDIDAIAVDAIEKATKASTEILEEEIKEYADKKKTISEFRVELEEFVSQAGDYKPLIFIVDELDRCRPTYAVEVLEQIKHFFSVSGIVFVLSIDKNHLKSSIKGFYGSSEIDSDEYLRRFIDLEYSMPLPDLNSYVEYLYEYFALGTFYTPERLLRRPFAHDKRKFGIMASHLSKCHQIKPRQLERMFASTRLILTSFSPNNFTFPDVLFYLVFLKNIRPTVFKKLQSKEFLLQEISDMFYEDVNGIDFNTSEDYLASTEASLLWLYNNSLERKRRINLIESDREGRWYTSIVSKLDRKSFSLADDIENVRRVAQVDLSLDILIKKINLNEPINI